jgi:hypothetical protein
MNMTADDHNGRAREIADVTRRYLVGLNTGGIAITVAFASSMAEKSVVPSWAVWPVSVFVLGLVVSGVSLFLAKHKALKRRDAARENRPEPDYAKWYWANFTYEIVTLVAFLSAVVCGLIQIYCMRL